jgi:hypothetical protein
LSIIFRMPFWIQNWTRIGFLVFFLQIHKKYDRQTLYKVWSLARSEKNYANQRKEGISREKWKRKKSVKNLVFGASPFQPNDILPRR